jgi:hypothetical protein
VIAAYSIPAVLLSIPIFYWLSVFFISQSSASIKETNRLSSTTNSPIISFYQESTAGASTIRSFGLQDKFKNEFKRLIN